LDIPLYQIDNRASRFTVRAFASGMLSAMGHSPTIAIRDFTGEAAFAPEVPEKSSLKLRIKADSLEVSDDISSKDRQEMERVMNQDVLEIAKYPEIVYESTGASVSSIGSGRWRADLSGNLSLHGNSRPQPVTLQLTQLGDMLRASGEFTVLQSTYGIKPVKVAGGVLKLKDELKFSFDIVARKEE
jgi:polyisoprenoid-binding protein YceI